MAEIIEHEIIHGFRAGVYQLRYRFKRRPTKADVDAARAAWLKGVRLSGVQVTPITWARTPHDARAALAGGGYVGRAGLVKYYARADRTLCDYDTRKPPSLWLVWRVARMMAIEPLTVEYNRTRRGWHVIIVWNRSFKPLEIVALQFAMASDPKRETFNLARVLSGKARNRRWNILFTSKVT